jgi:hypothetical protein
MDYFGELVVKFNSTMNNNINMSLLNTSTVDFYVDPATDESVSLEERLKDNLNLTWKLVKFQLSEMTFKLVFDDPFEISPLEEQDLIVMHIKNLTNPFYCSDPKVLKFLHKDFHTLRFKVKKQISDTRFDEESVETARIINRSIITVIFVVFGVQMIFGGGALKYFMWYLRTV